MTITLLCALAAVMPASYPQPTLLIEASDYRNQRSPSILLDVRPQKDFAAGHIDGAISLDVKAWDQAFAKPDVAEWNRRIGDAGLVPSDAIVIYAGDDVRDATRIWWILKYWGFSNVRLLNGGWSAWLAAGGERSTVAVQPKPRVVHLSPIAGALATKDQLLADLKDGARQIVDARSHGEYCGDAGAARRKGMIPGAIHLEWTEAIDPKTKKFKSPAELAALLRSRNIDIDKPAVTYCQSGGRASVMAFTLELMGGKQVRNYYKSWSEWGNADDTPVEVQKKISPQK